ncbi:MAG: twin-arginine translocase TatA/TatE family subunit [Acidimicrobiales bacterium]
MLDLSPAKILVVLVVALIVLGPDKLPGMARQMGALWGDVRRWRSRIESEVRGVFPDLPPTHQVAQAVRSPLSFLDRLADQHERGEPDGAVGDDGVEEPSDPSNAAPAKPSNGRVSPRTAPQSAGFYGSVPDDPSMN